MSKIWTSISIFGVCIFLILCCLVSSSQSINKVKVDSLSATLNDSLAQIVTVWGLKPKNFVADSYKGSTNEYISNKPSINTNKTIDTTKKTKENLYV
jgi:hypothetical protein